MTLPAAQIERARDVALDELAAELRLPLKRVGRELVGGCPQCGGSDRFAIDVKRGLWNCRGCQQGGGDAISLLRHVARLNFVEAVERLTGGSVTPTPRKAPPPDKRQADDDARRMLARAAAIGDASQPIADTPGWFYMQRRGINLHEVPDYGGLRFHPRCPWETGTTPCVLARFTDTLTCEPRGIWRRPIDDRKPKALGSSSGAVIRLWPDDNVTGHLVIGEGVETVLAAATRIEYRGTLLQPAWACGFAGNLANFPVIAGVEALTILADNDAPDKHGRRAGQEAAERCAYRWVAAGREVELLTPDDVGADFNDLIGVRL